MTPKQCPLTHISTHERTQKDTHTHTHTHCGLITMATVEKAEEKQETFPVC